MKQFEQKINEKNKLFDVTRKKNYSNKMDVLIEDNFKIEQSETQTNE